MKYKITKRESDAIRAHQRSQRDLAKAQKLVDEIFVRLFDAVKDKEAVRERYGNTARHLSKVRKALAR